MTEKHTKKAISDGVNVSVVLDCGFGNTSKRSNTFIIQLNNRSVKDRSFSRKIESERSFFVSEGHRIRWISGEVYSMYSRKAILWRRYGMWR